MFESRIELTCSPEEAFAFFIRPENLHRISPPEMGLVFVNPPEVLALGTILESKIQRFGQVQEVAHQITVFEPPRGIQETMVRGPLKKWVHDYLFEPTGAGAVTVHHRIDFEPPGGFLGFIVTEDRILDQLQDAFEYRRDQLRKLLG